MPQQVIVIGGGTTFLSYGEYFRNLQNTVLDYERLKRTDWKTTLAEKLGPEFEVVQPKMPNPMYAQYNEWEIWFEKLLPFMRAGAILVGQSLGGIFLVKFLNTHQLLRRPRAVMLVAAPFNERGLQEPLGEFQFSGSLRAFQGQAGTVYLYHSVDDPAVPFEHFGRYVSALDENGVYPRAFEAYGHFNIPEFPELVADIRRVARQGQRR